jgi:hypothetical protein
LAKWVYYLRWPIILLGVGWLLASAFMGVAIPRKTRINNILSNTMYVQVGKNIADTKLG